MYELSLTFKNKRDYNRFLRNLQKNKRTVIKPDQLVLGSGFGDFMKNMAKKAVSSDIAKNLAKKAISTVVNKTADFIDSKTGNTGIASSLANPLANVATQQVQNQMDKAGQGMRRGRKSAQNIYGMGANSIAERMAMVRSYKKGRSILSP